MDKQQKRFALKSILFAVNYLAIAGIVTGILIFFGYMISTSYLGDRIKADFEDSYSFDMVYEDYWYQTAQYINLKEMLEVDGEFSTDQEMELPIYLDDSEKIVVKYKLEDIIRWNSLGFNRYQEETETVLTWKLEERYYPANYDSLEAAVEEYHLNPEQAGTFYTNVADQLLYISNCVDEYHHLKNVLDIDNTSFRYYVLRGDGTVFTNLGEMSMQEANEVIENLDRFYIWNSATSELYHNFAANSILNVQREAVQSNWISYSESAIPYGIDKGGWNVITGVDLAYSSNDAFAVQREEFNRLRPLYETGISLTGVSAIVYLFTFIVLTIMAGRKPGAEEIILKGMDHWKTEIAIIFFGALAAGLLLVDFWCCNIIVGFFDRNLEMFWFCAGIAVLAAVASNMGLLAGWFSLIRRIKAGTLWKNSYLYSLTQGLQECWDARTVTFKTLVCFVGYFLLNAFLILTQSGIGVVLVLIINIAVGILLLRQAVWRQQIKEGIARIADGNLEYKINEASLSGDERYLAQAINNIGDGLANAVEKSVKSERLKADLITNVSHDIKTPLTSIINYVDLLKRENIPDEKVQGYIRVLDEKSQRLKTLTEDLVEASKVSSGNVKLEFANMDFVELINQTNGEFSEKFALKDLKLITNLPKEPAYIRADGRRIWRILENLYNNAAKYAMAGSRVYADLTVDGDRVVFTLKNMSEQPLNFAAEELTERFVRGDISRTTEGSGLGLSIAKNLTEIQRGTFEIYLDGDLFRVTVAFPRIK